MKPGCGNKELTTEILHERGQMKIRVAALPKKTRAIAVPIRFGQAWDPVHGAGDSDAMKQPEPVIRGVTKKMVREYVPKLIENGHLKRKPKNAQEWLLAEWHLARDLNLVRLRLACFVSETLHGPKRERADLTFHKHTRLPTL